MGFSWDDHWFRIKIQSWSRMRAPLHRWFTGGEIERIFATLDRFDPDRRRVVMLSFENRFAACGGLAAVMRRLPVAMQKAGERVTVLTPFFGSIDSVREAYARGELQEYATIDTVADKKIILYTEANSPVDCFHVKVDKCFQVKENPYAHESDELLARDALAFCAAIPPVLAALGLSDHSTVHAHDWETAIAALCIKSAIAEGRLGPVQSLLTLHNSFDAVLPPALVGEFCGKDASEGTFLASALPLMDGPLSTVSTIFAHELRHDSLQTDFFAPHLQYEFAKNPLVGIENGLFGVHRNPFGRDIMASAAKRRFTALLERKQKWRLELDEAILKKERAGGRALSKTGRKTLKPLFFMSGRLDLSQKGFDIIFRAFDRIPRGAARLLFTPSLAREADRERLAFFEQYQQRWNGDAIIWPNRLSEKLYRTCMRGASFMVMPSLYEPFGSATEAYCAGTPVIARATGGLWNQVVPLKPCPIPAMYGEKYDFMHAGPPTGLLFRETYESDEIAGQWRDILRTAPEQRDGIPLYRAMIDAAEEALVSAIQAFTRKQEYASMIVNGILLLDHFRWEYAAAKYRDVYNTACSRR